MKKFALNILFIAVITLVAASVLQALISMRIKGKTINGQDNFHIIKGQKNDIVFMGSSRSSEHFDPHVFKDSLGLNAVNMGTSGHGDITMQLLRLKYYLMHNPPPKVIVLNFDAVGLYDLSPISKNENLIEKNYYARYAFFPHDGDELIAEYFHFNFAEKYIPLYALLRYRCIMDCITLKDGRRWLKFGYQKETNTWDSVLHPIDTEWFADTYSAFMNNAQTIKNHIALFNDSCRQHHITLVCVQSPVFKKVYDSVAFNTAKKICADLGILLIDTNTDAIDGDINNFHDPDHLNETGVQKIMQIIIDNKEFRNLFPAAAP